VAGGGSKVRCPWCAHEDDKVVDSRSVERGAAIRRRRECRSCRRRYTTFERVEDLGLTVIKRDGTKEPYVREKLVSGIEKSLANRPVTDEQVATVAGKVEARLRRKGPQVTSQDVGLEVLAELKKLDQVAYVRYASVYKDFQEISDFERELGMLLQKRSPAKPRARR
jgi:transcriptional repressor NrdR